MSYISSNCVHCVLSVKPGAGPLYRLLFTTIKSCLLKIYIIHKWDVFLFSDSCYDTNVSQVKFI